MYKTYLTKDADKDLSKLTPSIRDRVLDKLRQLKFPIPPRSNIRKIADVPGYFRLRVGKIRVIFEVDNLKKEIWIRKIAYRKDIYR